MKLEWSLTIEVGNYVITEEGIDSMDEFERMVGNGLARVAMSAGANSDFGKVKVGATVSVACNQDEETVDRAGSITFHKSLELLVQGLAELQELRKKRPELFRTQE